MDHATMKRIRQLIDKHGSQLEGQALDDFLVKATEAFDKASKATAPVLKAPESAQVEAPRTVINQKSVQPLLRYFYGKVLNYCNQPETFNEAAESELKRIIFLQNLAKQLIQQEGVPAP